MAKKIKTLVEPMAPVKKSQDEQKDIEKLEKLSNQLMERLNKPKKLAPKPAKKSADFKNLPVVSFYYPRNGNENNGYVYRTVRVVEMNDTHVRGFEIQNELDTEQGTFKSYVLEKVEGQQILMLHLTPPEE